MRPSDLIRSTSFRLALIYLAVIVLSSVALAGFVAWSSARLIERQVQDAVDLEAGGLSERYRDRGISGLTDLIGERLRQDGGRQSIYLLLGTNGQRLAGNLYGWPDHPAESDGWVRFTGERIGDVAPAGEVVARVYSLPEGYDLLVGRVLTDARNLNHAINRALAWGLGGTLVLGIIGAWGAARYLMQRVDDMSRTARRIIHGDLNSRMVLSGGQDEFDRLAQSFNDMMDEIEGLVESIQTVTDNIAHDLRTPLNRMRSRIDVAMLSDMSGDECRGLLDSTLQDIDNLLQTFNALLAISKAESGARLHSFAQIDPVALLDDVAELYEPLIVNKGQNLTLVKESQSSLFGDRHLLFQALANIVDNAVKFTPPGGCIGLEVKDVQEFVVVTISDSGPGIPDADQDRVLERFVRLDATRSTSGNGLGLALVRAVVRLHDAQLSLENNYPGLKVRLAFPRWGGIS